MSRPLSAPKAGEAKDFPLHVHENVAFDLRIYCEALGSQWTTTINRAVRAFIDRELDENTGFKERFQKLKAQVLEEERRKRQAAARNKFRVVDAPARRSGVQGRSSGKRSRGH